MTYGTNSISFSKSLIGKNGYILQFVRHLVVFQLHLPDLKFKQTEFEKNTW